MEKIWIVYDSHSRLCVKFRWWMVERPKFAEMEFLPAGMSDALRLLPDLPPEAAAEEVVVVSDEGGVYLGTSAWLMCLWGLEDFREGTERLASPRLLPLVRKAAAMALRDPGRLSSLLASAPEEEIAEALALEPVDDGPDPVLPAWLEEGSRRRRRS